MYIRQTKTGTAVSGESYYTFRIVASERIGSKVRQRTLLNLGREFSVPRNLWPELCARIEQILSGQISLLPQNPEIEEDAERYAAQLVAVGNVDKQEESKQKNRFHEVDIDSLQLVRPRSIGVENLGLSALNELSLPAIFAGLGFNKTQIAAVIGSIVGRMAEPGSELSTWRYLQNRSGIGELIDYDFESMPLMQLYKVSDRLIRHRKKIEDAMFSRIRDLFCLPAAVTLYDLTNTFFEGKVKGNKKAHNGHSKEKRTDCPLPTLGLVLDGSGFIKRSQVFKGNVSEGSTLEIMLNGLEAPAGALIVMDRGIATQANIDWLIINQYRYLVVSRERTRRFQESKAEPISSGTGGEIQIYREVSKNGSEIRLYCHSAERAKKDEGITARFCKRFEEGLGKIAASLSKSHGTKKRDKVIERIGRLKERCRGIGQYYHIHLKFDEKAEKVTSLTWHQQAKPGTQLSLPGVYCLRTNELDWDDEALWRTYSMLTDLEAVFRCLKSELGLRPIYHRKEERSDGHLFITVLAYQAVQIIRRKLKRHSICDSWTTIRKTASSQQRVTATFRQKDGRTLHVRKATTAEPQLRKIYNLLGADMSPGGIKKYVN